MTDEREPSLPSLAPALDVRADLATVNAAQALSQYIELAEETILPEDVDRWLTTWEHRGLFSKLIAQAQGIWEAFPEELHHLREPADRLLREHLANEAIRRQYAREQAINVLGRAYLTMVSQSLDDRPGGERVEPDDVEQRLTHVWQDTTFLRDAFGRGLFAVVERVIRGAALRAATSEEERAAVESVIRQVFETVASQIWAGDSPPTDWNTSATPTFGPLFEVDNSLLYHAFRSAIACGRQLFKVPKGGVWPTADLGTRRQSLQAIAQVRPDTEDVDPFSVSADETTRWQRLMAQHVLAMDDLTADVLDGICAIWISSARHPDEMADVWADDLLRMRGLKPHKGGSGRRGGYKEENRREIARQIAALGTTWISVTQMAVTEKRGLRRRQATWAGESPALMVSFRIGQQGLNGTVVPDTCVAWRVRPGDVFARFLFGPGRQVAWLSQKALAYDPYRQRWEKRLARYLAWQWRIERGLGNTRTVETLLEAINEPLNVKRPSVSKERLEQALDTLEHDDVIAGWQYVQEDVDESVIGTRGWGERWVRWRVVIEPPQLIVEHYAKSPALAAATARRVTHALPSGRNGTAHSQLGDRLKQARGKSHMTQLQVAEDIGVDNATVSRIEHGGKASPAVRTKVARWLKTQDAG